MITTTSPSVLTPTNRQSAGTSTRISLFIVKQIPINRDTIPRQFSPVNPQRINNTIFPIDTGLFRASLPMFRNRVVNQSYFPFRIFAAALQPDFIQVNERIRQFDYPNCPVVHSRRDWLHACKGAEPVAFCPCQHINPHHIWVGVRLQFVATCQRCAQSDTGHVPTLGRLGKINEAVQPLGAFAQYLNRDAVALAYADRLTGQPFRFRQQRVGRERKE